MGKYIAAIFILLIAANVLDQAVYLILLINLLITYLKSAKS